jgi:7,8-dihydroneopterin aldolase/epimerase/oxygenase
MQTTVFIESLKVTAPVGIHAAERAAPQRILVDLELRVGPPPGRDDIAQAVCYEKLSNEIRALAEDRHRDLLETLAAEIAALCRADPRVIGGHVTLRKPGILGAAAVGVRLTF